MRVHPDRSGPTSRHPGIISAAMVRVNSVIVVWIPVTEVPRSVAIELIATFMLEPA